MLPPCSGASLGGGYTYPEDEGSLRDNHADGIGPDFINALTDDSLGTCRITGICRDSPGVMAKIKIKSQRTSYFLLSLSLFSSD